MDIIGLLAALVPALATALTAYLDHRARERKLANELAHIEATEADESVRRVDAEYDRVRH